MMRKSRNRTTPEVSNENFIKYLVINGSQIIYGGVDFPIVPDDEEILVQVTKTNVTANIELWYSTTKTI